MLGDAPCLRYEVGDGPAIHLPAPVQVHVFRFLQEAVANAIQHAHAKVIWVRLSQTETTLTLVIEDDGKGLPADVGAWMLASPDGLELAQAHGRLGLRGLLARARAMGGVCSLTAAEPGTRVALCLPLVRGG
jgi:signal transduction histidine kinase